MQDAVDSVNRALRGASSIEDFTLKLIQEGWLYGPDFVKFMEEEYDGEGVVKEYRAGECTQENCPVVDEAHGHILRVTTTEHTEKYDYKEKEDESFFGDVISKEQCQALGICIGIYIFICIVGYIKNKKRKKRSRN